MTWSCQLVSQSLEKLPLLSDLPKNKSPYKRLSLQTTSTYVFAWTEQVSIAPFAGFWDRSPKLSTDRFPCPWHVPTVETLHLLQCSYGSSWSRFNLLKRINAESERRGGVLLYFHSGLLKFSEHQHL